MAEALQNRWFHRPELHHPQHGVERKVGWLELFYDLIYVAAIIQLGNALSDNVSLPGFLAFFGVMAPIWFAWTSFTFFHNRFVVDDVLHRVMVFTQMLFIGAVAVSVTDVFDGQPQAWFTLRTTDEVFKLREGEVLQAGSLALTVVEIIGPEVVLETDGERWLLSLGDNLTDAFALPPLY